MLFSDETSPTLASIRRLKSQLPDLIEPECGLLDQLVGLEVLSDREYDKICAGDKAKYELNDAVLDRLTSEEQCRKFLQALQDTGQQHVVNFITQNGGQNKNELALYEAGPD